MAAQPKAMLAAGEVAPSTVGLRHAGTVVVVRDHTDGVQTRGAGSVTRLYVYLCVAVAGGVLAVSAALAGVMWSAVGGGVLSVAGVIAAGAESRRLHRWFDVTVDRLVVAQSELAHLMDDLPEAVLELDADGVVRSANAMAVELAGRCADEVLDHHLTSIVAASSRQGVSSWLQRGRRHVESGSGTVALTHEFDLRRGDATSVTVEASAERPLRRDEPGMVVRMRDVSERDRRAQALGQARQRFQQAFHSAPTGMALVRLGDGVIVDANRSLAEMLHHRTEVLVGMNIRTLTHPEDLRAAAASRARLELGSADAYLLDQRYRRSDGEYVWARTRVSVTEDAGVPLAITHIEDVTEQKRSAEALQWAATHDELTGLPNRTMAMATVDERLSGAALGTVGLLFVDLDNFKVVNDSLGHGIGDELLRAMSRRLRAIGRAGDLLARFGGDEFVIVVDVTLDGDPMEIAERTRAAINEPLQIDDIDLYVSGSVGVAVNDRQRVTSDELFRDADAAMYRAKARGRNCVERYAPQTHRTSVGALRTASELRAGMLRSEIVPYFQPIVELHTGQVVGFEALARWLHPERGLLTPSEFLPLAEETGLIADVGAAVLRDSLSQFARWRAGGLPFADVALAVNVGTRQIVDADFLGLLGDTLTETGIEAGTLWLEITESALLADVKASTVALRRLRDLGLHLAVDDFGTGFSSLTYLKRFPVEAIKIDRSFVGGLGIDAEDSSITEAVVNLGHSLNLSVVAEGIETPLQLSRLRELGCDRGQGYLFGRPRPAGIVEAERSETP